jgi:hypothetical protein
MPTRDLNPRSQYRALQDLCAFDLAVVGVGEQQNLYIFKLRKEEIDVKINVNKTKIKEYLMGQQQ